MTPERMRLNKFLSRAGVASRREADELIAKGRVKVDGRVVGVININNKISCTPFTEDDEVLLTSLAARVARAWEHASAHEASADRAEQVLKQWLSGGGGVFVVIGIAPQRVRSYRPDW